MIPAEISRQLPAAAGLLTAAQARAAVASLPHCRVAIEAALRGELPRHGRRLTEREDAECAFAEQLSFSVEAVDDGLVEALSVYMTELEIWTFAVAVYYIDLDVRLGLVAEAVL